MKHLNGKHTLRWFMNRVGKRIYRDDVSCQCDTCKKVTREGLIIMDDMQAQYLFMVQSAQKVTYRDKK